MPEKCTNASLPPSSGVMNPKPFSSLNHFTTPVANRETSSRSFRCARWCCRALPSRMLHPPPLWRPYGRDLYQERSARRLGATVRVAATARSGRRLRRGLVRVGVEALGLRLLLAGAAVGRRGGSLLG